MPNYIQDIIDSLPAGIPLKGELIKNIESKGPEIFLQKYLMGGIDEGMPFKEEFLQNILGNVNKAFDKSRMRLREEFAGRGTLGSGISAGALTEMAGERAGALTTAELGIGEADIQFRMDAINKLLGLMQFQEQRRQFEESQPGFLDFLGQILGAGTQVGTAGILSGKWNPFE